MKSLFLFSFLIIVSSVNSQILKKSYHDWNNTRVKYVYYVNNRGEYNGLLTQYSYDGAKLGEETWVNGVKNGPFKEYFTRGSVSKLKVTGNYKDDNKHGQWITYTYVKYGQSYFDIMQNMAFNDKEADIFNTGVQTKLTEETFNLGQCTKETKYHLNGKVFYTANFDNRKYSGDYVCYNDKNVVLAKGKIGAGGKMVGLWVIPREENGDCPRDKHSISNVLYTQKIKFDDNGNVDSNYYSKSYYLSNKLRDSVRLFSLEYTSGFSNGIWYFCGKNMATGKYKKCYENGKIMEDGQCKIINGKSRQVGIWKYYNQDGTIKEEKDYDALLLQEIQEKEKADSIKQDHTQKIEDWFEIHKTLTNEYSKLTTVYEKFRTSSMPYNGQYYQTRDYVNGWTQNIYVSYKKPELFEQFIEISTYCTGSKDYPSVAFNEKFPMKLSVFEENYNKSPENYFSSVEKLKKLISLIPKMIESANKKTGDLQKLLKEATSAEDKIKILENYQFEPK